jgi:hypothetical protein
MALLVGDRLPDVTLPRRGGEGSVELRRRGREGRVVVCVHGPACAACREYVSRLAELAPAVAEWDGKVVLVEEDPTSADGPGFDAAGFEETFDPGVLRERIGRSAPAVLIADQWGQLFAVEGAETGHDFVIQPDEVVDWLRFLATSCPECEGEAL